MYCDTYDYSQYDAGQALLRLTCMDQMQWLADVLIAAPPDMDLWNHYYAMRWIANFCGITDAQLGFINMVPSDRYGVSPNDLNPYFLPAGDGGQPWTPRDRTIPAITLAEMIRRVTGFVLFVDSYGYLQYYQFIPPDQQTPVMTYSMYNTGTQQNPDEMFGFSFRASTRDTRNQLALVGIDAYGPDWSPIVEKREDMNSIFTPPGYIPPANYCGYKKPLVWMDSRFANSDFASKAADQIFAIADLPDYTCSVNAWLQPGVYPMDVMMVDYPRANTFGIPFVVTEVSNVLSLAGSNLVMQSTLNGKLLEI